MAKNSQPIAGLSRPLARATVTSHGCRLSPRWVTVCVCRRAQLSPSAFLTALLLSLPVDSQLDFLNMTGIRT